MKLIKKLEKSYTSEVYLVEIDGKDFVLKTTTPQGAASEKFFYDTLAARNVPTLRVFSHAELKNNQLLLEYIENSPALMDAQTEENFRNWGKAVKSIHAITFPESFVITEEGEKKQIAWQAYLENSLAY